jgi:ubiquinone/menaquinone biosynthesis C-methylase UbiE
MAALPYSTAAFDTIVLNQVLHFADDPAAVLAEAARVLAPGGRVIVADFAPHAREDLRERYRHVRLGFDTPAMLRWFAAAGLAGAEIARLAGPQLSIMIWRADRAAARGV